MPTINVKLLFTSLVVLFNIIACVPDKNKNSSAFTNHTPDVQAKVTQNSTSINTKLTNSVTPNSPANGINNSQCNNQAINSAYQAQNPNQKTQVLGCGQITKLLKDDTDGSQHQKFLVKIEGYPQITVLIAHNIDLAHRINNIAVNQPIRFYGEYIYNPKGGVVHWTHKDPTARHQDGWLEYQGQKYQ